MFQRKRNKRIEVEVPVHCIQNGKDMKTRDVSETGAYILTADPFPEGKEIDLIFRLPRGKEILVKGEVKHVREDGMGVAFTEPHPEIVTAFREKKRFSFDLERTSSVLKNLFVTVFMLVIFATTLTQHYRRVENRKNIHELEKKLNQKIITMIHRKVSVGLFGVPVMRYIEVKDAEKVLAEIRKVPEDKPIGLVLHTPGGILFPAFQIARALKEHKGPVTVYVPHYAMSGGTLIALAADRIVMDPNAILGPVDPQLSTGVGTVPAVSVLNLTKYKPVKDLSDKTLIVYDQAQKSLRQVKEMVSYLLSCRSSEEERCKKVIDALVEGRVTHDYPVTFEKAKKLGLPVSTDMPKEIYSLISG